MTFKVGDEVIVVRAQFITNVNSYGTVIAVYDHDRVKIKFKHIVPNQAYPQEDEYGCLTKNITKLTKLHKALL